MFIKVLILFLLFLPTPSFSVTRAEKYQKIKKEIKAHKVKLQRAKKKERSIVEDIGKLDRESDKITNKIKTKRKEIKGMNVKMSSVKSELIKTTKTLDI